MNSYHGIIFAYGASAELGELTRYRTGASLPFCGRYRLIDFAISSMANAGIHDVGVIMQRDYQSLLDHLGSGKDWDMSRKRGGLRMLPPFGLPEYHTGDYTGTIEALNAVATYISGLQQKNIVLMPGNLATNLDLRDIIARHEAAGGDITAVCTAKPYPSSTYRYIVGEDGFSDKILFSQHMDSEGVTPLGAYIISKELLLSMMADCANNNLRHFHKNAVYRYLQKGGRVAVYTHPGYAVPITDIRGYFRAGMDMLNPEIRAEIFPAQRPVRTKNHVEVSTYYGDNAGCVNSLVSDGCIIEGSLENCILGAGVTVGKGAVLKNCILMRGANIGEGAHLNYVIADKYTRFSPYITLSGSERLPLVAPKNSVI